MNNSHNKNNYYSQMKDVYSNITNTELWKYLENDAKGMDFANDISRVCFDACNISGTITELLPNFTKHDHTHIQSVLDWMAKLLDNKLNILSKEETALLIMSACCHDVGMSISKANKKVLLDELETERLGQDIKEYLNRNKKIENEYKNRDKEQGNEELYNRVIRDYVRQNHHLRVEEVLGKETFNGLQGPLRKELIISLCRSHGEDLSKLKSRVDATGVRIYLLAILLRLADILNFDISRAPDIKFSHAGLDKAQSDEEIKSENEYYKNQICHWTISNDVVVCTGECPNNQLMHDVLDYVEWVKKEVESSNKLLNEIELTNNPLIVKQVETDLSGDFVIGDYKLKVNAKRVIDILGSENVYEDSRAFLTELIQNSIDAILVRTNIDRIFSIENGKIDVYVWEDNDYIWTRIDDNGFGMDENIIKNYFLTVGESFYNSYDYKRIQRDGSCKFIPLNRFGIGILSCFMNQSNVQLEVETKNIYNENVYRMDVTSLDGFYSLYKVDRTDKVVPLSAPPFSSDLTDGYNRDFGTSICVKQKKTCDDCSVENYKKYIDDHICLPIVDFNVYTCKDPVKYINKIVYIDSIERLMNGRKYRNIDDHFEVFYFNSLEDYYVSYGYEKSLNNNKLKDAKIIIIRVHNKIRTLVDDIRHNDLRLIIEQSISELNNGTHANITYNGLAIDIPMYSNLAIFHCINNGSWFEKVNLSKTKLLGLDDEVDYLRQTAESVGSFNANYGPMPHELFEAIEQKVLGTRQDYTQKGYLDVVYSDDGASEIERSDFLCLSYVYNLHIKFDKELKKKYYVHFSKEDRISRENSEFRYGLFKDAVCVFEDDSTTFKYNDMLNYNYPLIKWIISNSQRFSEKYTEMLVSISEIIEMPLSYKDLYRWFYDFLNTLKENGCDFMDGEILEYLESIKDKSGGPIIINERYPV